MRHATRLLRLALVALACGIPAYAEDGVLVLQVTNPEGQPVVGVQLSATGDSSSGPTTDLAGKTRIRLAPQTRPGHEVELLIVSPRNLVFISPWNGRVTVLPFENSTQMVVKVVLAERGSRMLLEYPQAQSAIAATVNSANAAAANARKAGGGGLTEVQRRANLAEVARAYGFTPEEVDRAIRSLGEKTTDPYQLGLTALYERNYPEATEQLTASVKELKQRFEEARDKLADAQLFLGQSLLEQFRDREAVNTLQQAAELRPDDSTILNLLGIALHNSGEYGRAEGYYQQALKLYEKQLGPEHLDVVWSLNNLAMLYRAQVKYAEAEPLIKRALAIEEKHLGPEHLDVAKRLDKLASLYRIQEMSWLHRVQGKYAEAEPLYKRALAIREKQLGPEHPDVAESLSALAWVYSDQGKYAEAEPLIKRALPILEKHLGPDSPSLARKLEGYANLLRKMNRSAEAEEMDARAKRIRTKYR